MIPRFPRCHFSRGRLNPPIAAPPFLKRLARSPDWCAAIFQAGWLNPPIDSLPFFKRPAQSSDYSAAISQEAGLIPQSPHRNFSRGWLDPLIAALSFFKRLVLSSDCCAAIFQETGMIPKLLRHHFSFGQRNPLPSSTMVLMPKPIWDVCPPHKHTLSIVAYGADKRQGQPFLLSASFDCCFWCQGR